MLREGLPRESSAGDPRQVWSSAVSDVDLVPGEEGGGESDLDC